MPDGDPSAPKMISMRIPPSIRWLVPCVLVGVLAGAGALVLNYERSAELINFGAFLAFMGVNAAVIRHSLRGRRR